ncbi:MSHA biogenesis protein MshK [Vibrio sp. S9_S30]|uniref:MSHA biogenesis protein MshK n=1 Tax=Vibrio sp. S9_S30 TaxID=2720226 RepID=UPI00168134FF|nr:MSHA biogenesis protein MshK [Vibrio sp. S9_S30]MBD1558978.1 MSHA biogenesis protein MshK [Vibrio sp. S9_S30]
MFFALAIILSSFGYANQDPTAPLGWQAPKTTTQNQSKRKAVVPVPKLQSIICTEGASCYAIIDDTVVEKGKYMQGYLVNRIEPEFVDLIKSGKRWRLELFPSDIKQ